MACLRTKLRTMSSIIKVRRQAVLYAAANHLLQMTSYCLSWQERCCITAPNEVPAVILVYPYRIICMRRTTSTVTPEAMETISTMAITPVVAPVWASPPWAEPV